ncbi:hypothetical protein Taro_004644 [Colocasia esculenta]|uniref:Uncharacterized protein n=1 Tax=Colocasia esculenta TaxID=4460 RepID=A0A843TVH3_COLES|nr:hypothetical protein [Colocasia esculenta]
MVARLNISRTRPAHNRVVTARPGEGPKHRRTSGGPKGAGVVTARPGEGPKHRRSSGGPKRAVKRLMGDLCVSSPFFPTAASPLPFDSAGDSGRKGPRLKAGRPGGARRPVEDEEAILTSPPSPLAGDQKEQRLPEAYLVPRDLSAWRPAGARRGTRKPSSPSTRPPFASRRRSRGTHNSKIATFSLLSPLCEVFFFLIFFSLFPPSPFGELTASAGLIWRASSCTGGRRNSGSRRHTSFPGICGHGCRREHVGGRGSHPHLPHPPLASRRRSRGPRAAPAAGGTAAPGGIPRAPRSMGMEAGGSTSGDEEAILTFHTPPSPLGGDQEFRQMNMVLGDQLLLRLFLAASASSRGEARSPSPDPPARVFFLAFSASALPGRFCFLMRGNPISIAGSTCSSPLPRIFCFCSSWQFLLPHQGKPDLHRCFHLLPTMCQRKEATTQLLSSFSLSQQSEKLWVCPGPPGLTASLWGEAPEEVASSGALRREGRVFRRASDVVGGDTPGDFAW